MTLLHFQRVAQVLQESEKRKFEQKQRERALARERKRLERELASQTRAVLAGGESLLTSTGAIYPN